MMPSGTAVTKQAITRTVGNNTSSRNKHHNLRWQDRNTQQRRNHRRPQYILWQHWTSRCQQHQGHRDFSQSNRMKPRSTSWSTVAQRRMSVHHGLRPTHPCTHYSMDKGHSWGQHPSVWVQIGLDDQRQQAATCCSLLCVWSHTTQLNETPTITHTKGFNSALVQREGLYFMTMEHVNVPVNMQLEVHQTAQGTAAQITPVNIWLRHAITSKWSFDSSHSLMSMNNQGFLVRVRRTQRKAVERLEKYRTTIVRRNNGNNENIEEAYQTLDMTQQKGILRGEPWTGVTWFKVKRGTPLPSNTQPMPALPATRATVPTATRPTSAQAADHPTGRTRYTTKQPPFDPTRATGSTSIPHPMSKPPATDYWIKEAHSWKRVHVKPRHDLYIPQQTEDGPDVTKLTAERATMVRPANGARWYRIDDDWTTKRQATLDQEWTGSTNFEETTSYKDKYITDDVDEPQEARKAKGLQAPQQPTGQERLEQELTHLPYRSWCPETPVVQCDITCYKAIGEQTASTIFTAIDVETSMCMAAQIENNTQSMQYLSTCLPQFLMECGRTHAVLNNTVIQSVNEDFLIALLKATATAMGSNIAVRQSPAYSIHITGTRQRRTLPSNIDGPRESTQATAWKQLQHTIHKQTSHHVLDGETRSLPVEQVCSTCRWQHQLLQTLEQGTQNTGLWIRWNSSLHVTNSKADAKDGSQILSSNLARQRHLNKREHLGHLQQGG